MKGIVLVCVEQLVNKNFGAEKWAAILEKAGVDRDEAFFATKDYSDDLTMRIVAAVCDVSGLSLQEVADAFGDHWVNEFAPGVYAIYYKNVSSAKEFLQKMPSVHEKTTRTMANARPPEFEYDWKDENTLHMKYKSQRDLIEFAAGLARGVGRHFNENLTVHVLDRDTLEILF